MLSEARRVGGTLLVPHADAGAQRSLYYLGWCGGPAGWARLFVALYATDGSSRWLDELEAAVKALEEYVRPG